MPELLLHGLEFGYLRPLFAPLNLECRHSTITAVLGANGCGKTTLMHTVIGVLPPLGGRVQTAGRPGFVPQIFASNLLYKVLDIVLMGRVSHIKLLQMPSAKDEGIAREALERLGIGQLAEQTYNTLSGGQRQLVLIARALAARSTMLVLDEPTAALDLQNQNSVLRLMRRLSAEGMSMLFTTHDPTHALLLADKVLLLLPEEQVIYGDKTMVLTEENLRQAYGIDIKLQHMVHGGEQYQAFVPILDVGGMSVVTRMKPTKKIHLI